MRSSVLQHSRKTWWLRGHVAALGFIGLLLATPTVSAQQTNGVTKESSDGNSVIIPRPEWRMLPAKAPEQLAAVEQAVSRLKTSDMARAAGFQPVLGLIPTMGEHWISFPRMIDRVNVLEPEQLMFSPVNGEMRLVGVAYAYFGPLADAPDLFDGDQDTWHVHPEFEINLAPGQPLVMLHVWFVPSPDGPFAGHNPWLPYWAAGIQPPPDSTLAQAASALRTRRLALALAEALEPMPLVSMGDTGVVLPPGIELRRDSLRVMIPRLNTARRAEDWARWDREADAAIAMWEKIRDMYLEAIPQEGRQQLAAFYQEMATGEHAHAHGP